MQFKKNISTKGVIRIIQRTCNHVDPRLMDHGLKVSYIVSKLLRIQGTFDAVKQRDICFVAMLHDIGAYKTEEIDRMLQFESVDVKGHSIYGYLFLRNFSPLNYLSEVVLYHHTSWSNLEKMESISEECKFLSQLVNIADRAELYMRDEFHTWGGFLKEAEQGIGTRYKDSLVALMRQAGDCSFNKQDEEFYDLMMLQNPLTQTEVEEYMKMIVFAIDFRSGHTVTHTITTTSISYELAGYLLMDESETNQIVCGALLHDLGKIGIPVEILEKPGKLLDAEMAVMRTHVQKTAEIFGDDVDETIKRISLRHHEKLDGSGYPAGLTADVLTRSERIVAVADIVSALAGVRSYKKSYQKQKLINIICKMKEDGLLDGEVVSAMVSNFDKIIEETDQRCRPVLDSYLKMQSEYCKIYESNNYVI